MLRCSLIAALPFLSALLVSAGAVAGSNECAVPSEPTSEHSLMQRASRSLKTVAGSEADVFADSDFDVGQMMATEGELTMSQEELDKQDADLDRLAAHLEERRALIARLRQRSSQPHGPHGPKPKLEGHGPHGPKPGKSTPFTYDQKDGIVPVPFYIHHERESWSLHGHPNGTGDLLGDALEPHHHGTPEEEHTEHGTSHFVLLFLFSVLVIGSILQILLERFAPQIPYTCMLFIVGTIVSIIHKYNEKDTWFRWGTWYLSVEMWQNINPHLLFYVFLPALLFGDVMKLKVQLVAACSGQIFLLACPGVILGTFLTALVGRFLLPYDWDWPICLVFGSILAATDPVAVVSLFNSLGVSPRLTMLISGESLANDGTAIVCFALALKLAQGASLLPWSMVYFFLYMILPSIIVGFAIGFAGVALIGFCSEAAGELDAMIQVVVTLACGYMAFFIAENEIHSSGVIATVASGLAVAHSAWPLFVNRETIHTVWEAIEFIGNTIIFFLAGLIFMDHVLTEDTRDGSHVFGLFDFTWLLALYGAMMVIRSIVMGVFWIPLNMAGQPVHWPEAVAMVWSGLRGAVSLAMGMIVDIEKGIDRKTGQQVMFHVGGFAALTLIVNSVTTAPLLRALGLVKSGDMMNRVSARLSTRIAGEIKETFERLVHKQQDARFFGANVEQVKAMVPVLHDPPPGTPVQQVDGDDVPVVTTPNHRHLTFLNTHAQINLEWKLVQVFREVFLRVVQSRYWQGIQDGVIPRQLMVSRVLLHSTEEALDNTSDSLKDWDIIAKALKSSFGKEGTMSERWVSRLVDVFPFNMIPQFRGLSLDSQQMMKVFIALTYIEAHTFAQEEIPLSLGRDDPMDVRVQKQVIHESNLQKQKALEFVALLPSDSVELGKSEMLARKLLRQHIHEIEEKEEAGFLSHMEAEHLCEPCRHALREIAKLPSNAWKIVQKEDESASGSHASPQPSPRDRLPGEPDPTRLIPATARSAVPVLDARQPTYMYQTNDPGAALLPGSGIRSQGDAQPVLRGASLDAAQTGRPVPPVAGLQFAAGRSSPSSTSS